MEQQPGAGGGGQGAMSCISVWWHKGTGSGAPGGTVVGGGEGHKALGTGQRCSFDKVA